MEMDKYDESDNIQVIVERSLMIKFKVLSRTFSYMIFVGLEKH